MSIHSHTEELIEQAKGLRIDSISLTGPEYSSLVMSFVDGSRLVARDEGQDCCENRYMSCDDALDGFIGAQFTGMKTRDGPSETDPDSGEVHDIQFLVVETSEGSFTVATHNEHNGYYGGFELRVGQ